MDNSASINNPNDDKSLPKVKSMLFFDLNETHKNIGKILKLFEERLKYDKVKEEAFNRLYDELESVKHDREFQKIKPLYLDLILLYDRLGSLKSKDNAFDTIRDELLEILSRQDVEIINMESNILDLSLHKIIDTQMVEDEELNNKVVKVLRDGFICKDRVLRVQEVKVGKYIQPKEEKSGDA